MDFSWIDYVILAIVALIIAGVIYYLVGQKKKGRSSCPGCQCSGCPVEEACRPKTDEGDSGAK